jgi:hypothetical protein
MRIVGLVFILTLIFSSIVSIFWYQELQYLLPTPVPRGYKVVLPDSIVRFTNKTLIPQSHTRPKLLHFFNPTCPCSRFNVKHFLSLQKKYNKEIDFYVVVTSHEKVPAAKKLIDTEITILVDENEMLAGACGVYSTPQAALLQVDNRLYFRGNYNRSRYCVDKNTNFVQMALDSIVARRSPPHFIELATESFGCAISKDKDTD